MLFAYAIQWDGDELPAALPGVVAELNHAWLPPGWGLAPVIDRTARSMRGYEPDAQRGHLLALVHALRELSLRVPVTVMLSGGFGLPPTSVRDGRFQLFPEFYEEALSKRVGWATRDEARLRVPSPRGSR